MITLEPFKWYAWQMLPGYHEIPYFSPIYVRKVVPQKMGTNLLKLDYINSLYAVGVQSFVFDLKVLKRTSNYMIVGLPNSDRSAIISEISFAWLEAFTPELLKRGGTRNVPKPFESDIQNYLSAYFTGNPENHIEDIFESERRE